MNRFWLGAVVLLHLVAVEASGYKRMADSWSLRVSYLWSRLHGNYTGLGQGDENGRVSPNVGRNFDYYDNGVGDYALYGHIGGDVGDSHSWRGGVVSKTARAR